MPPCPTCDRNFDTEHGVYTHHAQSHGINLTQFEEDQKWVKEDLPETPVEEVNIDRMVKHAEDTIKQTAERFNLNTTTENIED